MNIFQMSFSAAILIIIVVILRALTLYKLPKKTFLILWGVVICRLLIPFSFPSRISFYTGIDMIKGASTEINHFSVPSITTNMPDIGVAAFGKLADSDTSAISISISPLMLIWLIGMVVCTIFFIAAYIKCYREFKTALPVENDFITLWQRKHPLRFPVHIRQSDRINAPLTYGVLHPVLLLPKSTDWSDQKKLQYILTHEFVHIKRFDTLTKLLLTTALCIHWLNPFVWLMYVLMNRDIELSCDETVVRTFGERMKSSYALTLIGLEEKKSQLTPLCNSFSKNAIEERITAIMKIKKYSRSSIIVAVLLVFVVTVGFATSNAKTSNNPNTQDNAEVLTTTLPYTNNAPFDDMLKNNLTNVKKTTTEPTSGNTSSSSSPVGNEPAENNFQNQSKTDEDSVIISKRFYPITGEYLITRIDPETGDSQVSFDDGATWLFRRVDSETSDTEYSTDGITWYDKETLLTNSGN